MAQGIYLIENNLNHKKYIGQSVNIKTRWAAHKNYKAHMTSSPKSYNAFEKYGIENFTFTILEEVKFEQDLTPREQYWINYYDTINNGYNIIRPIDSFSGELNPQVKLNWTIVKQIKEILKNTNISIQQIASQFNIHYTQIYRINRGETWFEEKDDYPIRKTNDESRPGSQNGRSKLTEAEVLNIRQRYVNESVSQIYEDYKHLYSFSGFKKIVHGTTFKNVPIYNKQQQLWIQPK